MPEKSQKRKLRSDQSTSQFDIETASSINDENAVLWERDFEDISNKIENKISKRLRDTELNQREILKLIESLSSKVDNLSSVNSEQGYLTTRTENSGNPTEELEEVSLSRNESSNTRSDQNTVNDYFTLSTITYFDWFPHHIRRRKLIVLHFNLVHNLTGIHFQSEKQSKCVS